MKLLKFFLLFSILIFLNLSAYSTTWTITAGGIVFTPSTLTATAGDTVKWQWLDGSHTTTSDAVPTGAMSWNEVLDASHQTYFYVLTHAGTYNYHCIPHQSFGMIGVINVNPNAIEPIGTSVPDNYKLEQNFPNPFNPATNIRFDLPKNSNVRLVIYDITGSRQAVLVNNVLNAGSYNVDWDASGFPSGVYFYILTTDGFQSTKKMVLTK
jgi:plastocyanin